MKSSETTQKFPKRNISASKLRDNPADIIDLVAHDKQTVSIFNAASFGDCHLGVSPNGRPEERPMLIMFPVEEYERLLALEKAVKELAAKVPQ